MSRWKDLRMAELADYQFAEGALAAAAPLFERPWFTYIYDGAIQFEWEGAGHYLEIEVHPDGTWKVLHMTAAEEPR